ncbi:dethiobiotin synthase [Rhodoferax saidenbachensis]|uniref:ATP-dependent dethiobiotin synthetase BioD n=1 Tax=Rhodoferax saidenbachensis TaxID=1484693 RepID=A0ABU1ZH60_9BURK|nr:dethiobiotin synthase [Rhodoferax saidenbachensis]MDR7304882.1 dethiobiotin synthetase [Rhodoferax saidenbachensis]
MASEPACIFVTGTDTGVGKTLISAALLHAYRQHYARVVGMKPVAAGLELRDGQWVSDDVQALSAASSITAPARLTNPVALHHAMSPHLAARLEDRHVTVAELLAAQRELATLCDAMVVEGSGGWRVPVNDTETLADFAIALQAPVVLVVGMRLGCLNHALLTAEAIRRDGLTLAGWVANTVSPDMPVLAENIDTLRQTLDAPLLGVVPWSAAPDARHITLELPAP